MQKKQKQQQESLHHGCGVPLVHYSQLSGSYGSFESSFLRNSSIFAENVVELKSGYSSHGEHMLQF